MDHTSPDHLSKANDASIIITCDLVRSKSYSNFHHRLYIDDCWCKYHTNTHTHTGIIIIICVTFVHKYSHHAAREGFYFAKFATQVHMRRILCSARSSFAQSLILNSMSETRYYMYDT